MSHLTPNSPALSRAPSSAPRLHLPATLYPSKPLSAAPTHRRSTLRTLSLMRTLSVLAALTATSLLSSAHAQPAPSPAPAPTTPPPAAVTPARAASTPKPSAPVELPPMMVEESSSTRPWLYAQAGGIEFLSRCSASTTRDLAEAWLTQMQLVRALIPPEFLVRLEVPEVFVLYGKDSQRTISAEIERELRKDDHAEGSPRKNDVNVALSMRLSDRDMHAAIAYLDESQFDGTTLTISSSHVRYLLEQRVPALPPWLIEGLERLYRRADFIAEPITLRPLVWQNSVETEALGWDPTRPRALLPASDLFAPEPVRAKENFQSRHVTIRAATQELFVRWALLSSPAHRAALWKLAARAADTGGVTEELFESCFGFDFAELRDRLSDYLPKAVFEEAAKLTPGPLPPLPAIEIAPATPHQIARVRGEWERLAIGHVQRRLPRVREPYILQARRTLHRAYDAGDRDPRLLVTMGLCEIDSGDDAAGLPFLEAATALGVVRPRAYHELARLRYLALRRDQPDSKRYTFAELAPVIFPLRQALKQSPPLPEIYILLAEVWAHCDAAPTAEEMTELQTGARLFARRPSVALPLAKTFSLHGQKAEAAALLESCAGYLTDDPTQSGITQLRTELATESPRPTTKP